MLSVYFFNFLPHFIIFYEQENLNFFLQTIFLFFPFITWWSIYCGSFFHFSFIIFLFKLLVFIRSLGLFGFMFSSIWGIATFDDNHTNTYTHTIRMTLSIFIFEIHSQILQTLYILLQVLKFDSK